MIEQSVAVIGTGQMGGALIKSFARAGLIKPENIIAYDLDRERINWLVKNIGITPALSNQDALEKADIVLLALKPQIIDSVLAEIKEHINTEHLVISIAAGVSLSRIYSFLGDDKKVIRVMPNTPAQIGKGISVISPGENVNEIEKEATEKLFRASGEVIFLDESFQPLVTGISGSGPAYFFLMAEFMIEAGIEEGLSREIAEKLVIETMMGAASLLKESGKTPEDLRKAVTSPGGTTMAAIQVFEDKGFRDITSLAIKAAIKRAIELGQ